MRRVVPLALLFAGAAGISALIILKGMQPNDEGLMLQAAARIADGEVPYRDFWWFYPPGQPYLLAGLTDLFGHSLLTWRVLRVLTNAAVALLAYLLARRFAPWPLALLAWLGAAVMMAAPTGPHPYPIALALALGALLAFDRRPLVAGVLVGLVGVWRIEFAAYLGLAILVGYAVRPDARRLADSARVVGASLATALLFYAPVVLAAGIGDSWELLIRYPIEDFSDYQSLPFPTDYPGGFDFSGPRASWNTIGALLNFYLPLALLVGMAAALLALALRFDRTRWRHMALAVFGIGMTHYLVTRPDPFHTAPLAVVLAVLGSWLVADAVRTRRAAGGWSARLAVAPAVVLAALMVWIALDGLRRTERQAQADTVPVQLAVADGVRELAQYVCSLPGDEPAQVCRLHDLEATVRLVRREVPAGEPIYVATRRADLVTSGAPMIYYLADRPSATRYDIAAPGVVTSAPVQREIVSDLVRKQPLVVRWTATITAAPEPNRAGRSTGVRILDDYLLRRYRQVARFGSYLILEPRA